MSLAQALATDDGLDVIHIQRLVLQQGLGQGTVGLLMLLNDTSGTLQ